MGNRVSIKKHFNKIDDTFDLTKFAIDLPFKHLDCCQDPPDVTLIVEKMEIPAHRAILSEQSEYFRAMFSHSFIESKSDRIELKEVNFKTFKRVLEYMYGINVLWDKKITHPEIFELIEPAHYFMADELTKAIFERLKIIAIHSPNLLLNYALANSVDELITVAVECIERKSYLSFVHCVFDHLDPAAVDYLLKRGLNTHESYIFAALVKWMRAYPEHKRLFPGFLAQIDFYLVDKECLDMLVKPRPLIDHHSYKSLLKQPRNPRPYGNPDLYQHVASSSFC
uniref:BTB domain-containing protein n=1 Tax=Panagrellus redivivus TaxID=6233 RepID=A0A7E4WBX3_PANRE